MRADHPFRAAPLVVLASCAALLLASSSAPTVHAAACANEAIRVEQGPTALALPDCRAFELSNPGSMPALTSASRVEAGGKSSPAGDAISYVTVYPPTASPTSSETWISRRTASGWAIEALEPQVTPTSTSVAKCQPAVALSEELDAYLLSAGGDIYSSNAFDPTGECGIPAEELVAGEPRGFSNLYLRQEGANNYELANPVPVGETPGNATYLDGSDDLSRIAFSEAAKLTPEAPAGTNLFIWSGGVVRLIGVLPNGESVPAELPAATGNWDDTGGRAGLAPVSHAVSADGERVFFEAGGNLYLRENASHAPAADANCLTTSEAGLACTLQLDRSLGAGADGGGVFQFASRDGGRAFFTSDHALTFPSSAQAGKADLYEYDVDARELSDLTVGSGEGAQVRGFSGGSDDGSHLYFVARGVLTGSEQNEQGEIAQAGQPNLYLSRERSLTYIATLSPWEGAPNLGGKDRANWFEPNGPSLKTAWSPSGRYLLFSSRRSLTGFDNSPATPGLCGAAEVACQELFLYDADSKELSCVSCGPGGAKPVADSKLNARMEFQRFIPGPRYLPRIVLDSGQVFFETENALSPQDINGFQDVYEYRAGNLNLISSGTAVGGSGFVDASVDGSNVFFVTSESLVRRDVDGGLPSLYDARVDGGFTEPPLPPPPCAGEECHPPPPPPPPSGSPATGGFVGPGNVKPKPCKHGKVRRGGKCVKKKHHHPAGNNRGKS